MNNIKKYCQTNDFSNIDPKYIKFIRKRRAISIDDPESNITEKILKPIDLMEYNLRINVKSENSIAPTHENVKSALSNWRNKRKFFRMKQRYSFKLDNDFVYDLTILRTSKTIFLEESRRLKLVYTRTFQESDVAKNDLEYEVELEYIGNNTQVSTDTEEVYLKMTKYLSLQYYRLIKNLII